MKVSADAEAMINARIAQIDHLLSIQLNEILHHAAFQKLEGTWRGLKYLMDQSETSDQLKIKVLNVSKKELLRDLQRAPEFDQSALFKKVYEEEFGIFGGAPFGALIGDYEFGQGRRTSNCSRRSRRWRRPRTRRSSRRPPPRCSTWRATRSSMRRATWPRSSIPPSTPSGSRFRQSEDSRYVGLCLPRMLIRLPYGKDGKPVEAFNYEENVDGTDHTKYLLGECGVRDCGAHHHGVRDVRLVRGDPRRGRRRTGRRACRCTTSRPTTATWP